MENNNPEAVRPLNTEGLAVAHRGRITDRQKTAQRLLFAAAEQTYDGDLDVNWDAPLNDTGSWFPEHMSTLHGSAIWASLTPEQRTELGRHELVNMLSFGVYVESAMTLLLLRDVAENDHLVDDFTRYLLKSVQEETRNSFMFTRLINTVGLDVYRLTPFQARALSTCAPLIPAGATTAGVVLLAQEVVHSFAQALAESDDVQTHIRQVMRIHEMADSRHIEFSRIELTDALAKTGRIRRILIGHALAYAVSRVYPMLLDSRVYADVGVPVDAAMRTAKNGPAGVRAAQAMTGSFVRFASSLGLFQTGTEKRILRRAGLSVGQA